MQTRMYKLSQCINDLDALLSELTEGNLTRASGWYGHKLEGKYIGQNSLKQPDPHFFRSD